MRERQRPNRVDDIPKIDTPVIDMQDLEHNPSPETRVNTMGIKVRPQLDATWNGESESSERR
ncbi:MAG: hypothetical protein H7Y89_06390 [Steroidobacteraceae bacterium]|nr:hypothetical protein [Steroidobacteraceae bacterium]